MTMVINGVRTWSLEMTLAKMSILMKQTIIYNFLNKDILKTYIRHFLLNISLLTKEFKRSIGSFLTFKIIFATKLYSKYFVLFAFLVEQHYVWSAFF